ncbi:hypothetical protein NDU88_003928 [Pleurodeles waltl]|uniref:Uncharacterized protein n=1 Tax=Pleurodeles waltl TaxID=8319 RepID=A0AAV7W604_PLEWA|nr:hypothetical protein NDU88_003928 [Pleurodeles waltl]
MEVGLALQSSRGMQNHPFLGILRQRDDVSRSPKEKARRQRKESGSRRENHDNEDSWVPRSGKRTGEEEPKTKGENSGEPTDQIVVGERRESGEASHGPGGMWLLQVWDCVCGPLTKLIGKGRREREGGLGTPEHST